MIRLPHRSVILVASAVAFSLLGDQALYAILPTYFKELGLMPFQVGILLSINRWIRLFTNHLAERLTRRFSPTRLLVGALVLGSALTAVYGSLTLFPILLIARMLWGLCWSFIRQVGIMTSVDSASDRNIGQVIGFYNGVARIGSIAGNFFGALLHDVVGFCSTFLILGAVSLLGVPLGGIARRGLHSHRSAFRSPQKPDGFNHIIGLLVRGFVMGCVGSGLITSTLGFILQKRIGDSVAIGKIVIGIATMNGLLLASGWIINIFGAPILGAFLDRIGHRTGAFIFFIGSTITLFAATTASKMPLLFFLVLAFFICGTAIQVVLAAEAGKRGSKIYSFYATAVDFGAAIGPILGWTIFEFISVPVVVFAIGGSLYAIATLFYLKAFTSK